MKLVIRIITVKEFLGDAEALIQVYLRSINLIAIPRIIKFGEYYKMKGHKEILFEINEELNFKEIVNMSGDLPVFLTHSEAIFDSNQGSVISVNSIFWMHLEIALEMTPKIKK